MNPRLEEINVVDCTFQSRFETICPELTSSFDKYNVGIGHTTQNLKDSSIKLGHKFEYTLRAHVDDPGWV